MKREVLVREFKWDDEDKSFGIVLHVFGMEVKK